MKNTLTESATQTRNLWSHFHTYTESVNVVDLTGLSFAWLSESWTRVKKFELKPPPFWTFWMLPLMAFSAGQRHYKTLALLVVWLAIHLWASYGRRRSNFNRR